jgi:hypothetical protein
VPGQPDADLGPLIVRHTTSSRHAEQLPSEESGYEIPAAIVYERANSWYRIALQRGSAWVAHPNRKDFLPYPELLLNDRLTYIRGDWDGRLWTAPETGTRLRMATDSYRELEQNIPVDVIAIRRVQQQTWIQVRVTTQCDGPEEKKEETPITGWIPAYRSDGRPSAWFYSRGC